LTRECNNRCIFCGQEGLGSSEAPGLDAELATARDASRGVTFVGGEPTLDLRLLDAVGRAREMNLSPLVLQTNGAKLDGPLAERLAAAGLTAVHLSIHGADPEVHDYHTGNPGSLARVLSALDAVKSAGLVLSVTTIVTRSNFRVLSPIAALVARKGAAAWMLAFPEVAGRAAQAADRVIPRFGLAVPYALHAVEAARRAGLPALVSGVPACLLGPFASRTLPAAARAFAEVCTDCEAREQCPGVDPDYLARFDGDELSRAARTVRDASVVQLASLFAGPGQLARSDAAGGFVTSKARRSLPMLGKVKPATAEAPPNTVRRSGEALREIFPALFAGDARGRPK
jgi:hypothetical protein